MLYISVIQCFCPSDYRMEAELFQRENKVVEEFWKPNQWPILKVTDRTAVEIY